MSGHSNRDSGLAVVVEEGDADEQSDMAIAKDICHQLTRHYPGHPWTVSVQGRGIIVRHTIISMVAGAYLRREGFSYLMPREKMGTPKEIEHSAIMAGGNMLELFNLPRGEDTGKLPEVPKDWVRKQQKDFA
jgi:hypothetical protein